ncbi:MAG: integrase core domain-containing protein [Anaerolineales bacterium]|nr:integrase core domain-containing protein [Anaerolineales bacterium]
MENHKANRQTTHQANNYCHRKGSLSDLKRSRRDLIIENALLRQQLIVLKRQVKRPQLTQGDRLRLVFLARLNKFWKHSLHIVQPNTLLRWHRDLFRRYWRRKSKSKQRKPRILPETIKLIKQIVRNNFLWGAERIRGELLKLGIKISKRTIQKYMPKNREKTSQTWKTFLTNHASQIWACDFTVVHDLFFRPLYIFVIIELQSRRVVHAAVTRSPTDEWSAQQLREATPWGAWPKYLIRDRDKKFGTHFAATARGIMILKTPIRAPKVNSFCERFIGSLKREFLDHIFILHRHQLHRIVQEYIEYFNSSRPHQGIDQQIPNAFVEKQDRPWPISQPTGRIISTPILGGLHHSYERVTVNTN